MRGHPWYTVTAFWKTTMTYRLTVHEARFTGHVMNHHSKLTRLCDSIRLRQHSKFLVRFHAEQQKAAQSMAVKKSVSADIKVEINPFWQPELHLAIRKIHGSVIDVRVFGN